MLGKRLHEQAHRVQILRSRYEHLVGRTRRPPGAGDVDRLDGVIRRRENELAHLDQRISDLCEERDRLRLEMLGCLTGAEALLTDLVDQVEAANGHNWSPRPITGFTALEVGGDGLHDGDTAWPAPEVGGTCPSGSGGAPHTQGRCRERACGVVVWKSTASLPDAPGLPMLALAAVDLTGRIVEHEAAYRAEHARVSAMLVTDWSRWLRTRDADRINRFWMDPAETFEAFATEIPAATNLTMDGDIYLGASHG